MDAEKLKEKLLAIWKEEPVNSYLTVVQKAEELLGRKLTMVEEPICWEVWKECSE